GVVVGADLDAQAVAGRDQVVLHVAVVQGQAPLVRAGPALAADLGGGGARPGEFDQPRRGPRRSDRRNLAGDDLPEGRRLVAAADIGVPALVVGWRPDQADLRRGVVPALVEAGAAIARTGVAAGVAPLHLGHQGPVVGQAPVQAG